MEMDMLAKPLIEDTVDDEAPRRASYSKVKPRVRESSVDASPFTEPGITFERIELEPVIGVPFSKKLLTSYDKLPEPLKILTDEEASNYDQAIATYPVSVQMSSVYETPFAGLDAAPVIPPRKASFSFYRPTQEPDESVVDSVEYNPVSPPEVPDRKVYSIPTDIRRADYSVVSPVLMTGEDTTVSIKESNAYDDDENSAPARPVSFFNASMTFVQHEDSPAQGISLNFTGPTEVVDYNGDNDNANPSSDTIQDENDAYPMESTVTEEVVQSQYSGYSESLPAYSVDDPQDDVQQWDGDGSGYGAYAAQDDVNAQYQYDASEGYQGYDGAEQEYDPNDD